MKQVKRTSAIMKIVIASVIVLLTFFASFGIGLMVKNNKNIEGVSSESAVIGAAEDYTNFNGGYGTEASPYRISNSTHLTNLRNLVNNRNSDPNGGLYRDKFYKVTVTSTINLGTTSWAPIGNDLTNYFGGVFDGNGCTINYTCSSINVFNGLFGVNYGIIKNVIVSGSVLGCTTTTTKYVGGICGANGGIIDHCQNRINLTPTSSSTNTYFAEDLGVQGSIIGGIAGCSLPANNIDRDFTGQGKSMVSITNCENRGSIYGNIAGGILGGAYLDTNTSNLDTSTDESRITFLSFNVNNSSLVRGYIAGGILGTANHHSFTITNNVNICSYLHAICMETNQVSGGFLGLEKNYRYLNTVWNNWDSGTGENLSFATIEGRSGIRFGAAGGIVGSNFNYNFSSEQVGVSSIIIKDNITAGLIRSDVFSDAESESEIRTNHGGGRYNCKYTIGYLNTTQSRTLFSGNRFYSFATNRYRHVFTMKNNGELRINDDFGTGIFNAVTENATSISSLISNYDSLCTTGFDSEYWNRSNILSLTTNLSIALNTLNTGGNITNSVVTTVGITTDIRFINNVEKTYHTSTDADVLNGENGDGTPANPYLVNSAADLVALDGKWGTYIMLTQDIDLSGAYWKPIYLSTATFDGRGFKITGLKCIEYENAGLFSAIGKVKNLIIEDCEVLSFGYASPITSTKLSNCNILQNVEVSSSGFVSGGIETAGVSFTSITSNSKNIVSKAEIVSAGTISGIVDRADTINNCINGTRITAYPNNGGNTETAKLRVGGISVSTSINIYNSVSWFNTSNNVTIILPSGFDSSSNGMYLNYSGSSDPIKTTIDGIDDKEDYNSDYWDTELYFYDNNEVPSLDLRLKVYIQGHTIHQKYDESNNKYDYDSSSISSDATWYISNSLYKDDLQSSHGLEFSLRRLNTGESATTDQQYFHMVKGEKVDFTINCNDLCMLFAYSTQCDTSMDISKKTNPAYEKYFGDITRNFDAFETKGTGSIVLNNDNFDPFNSDTVTLIVYATDRVILDISSDGYDGLSTTTVNNVNYVGSNFDTYPNNANKKALKTVSYGDESITMWSYPANSGLENFPFITRTGYILTSYYFKNDGSEDVNKEDDEFLFGVDNSGKVVFQRRNYVALADNPNPSFEPIRTDYINSDLYDIDKTMWINMSEPIIYIYPKFINEAYDVTYNIPKEEHESVLSQEDTYVDVFKEVGFEVTNNNIKGYYPPVYLLGVPITGFIYEITSSFIVSDRYGYIFDGWFFSNGSRLTNNQGEFVYLDGYTKAKDGKYVWIRTEGVELYAKYIPIARKVLFNTSVNYTNNINAELLTTFAYIKMSDYGKYYATDSGNGGVQLYTGNQNVKLYTDSDCTILINNDNLILNKSDAYRFDGWFTEKDSSMVEDSLIGNVLTSDYIINSDVIDSGSIQYTNGNGGLFFNSEIFNPSSLVELNLYAHFTILTYKIELKVDSNYYENIANKYKEDSSTENNNSILTSYIYALYGSNYLTDKNNTLASGYTASTISKGLRPGYKFIGWYIYDPSETVPQTEIKLIHVDDNTNTANLEKGISYKGRNYTNNNGLWIETLGINEGVTLYAKFEINTGANLKFATSTDLAGDPYSSGYSAKVQSTATGLATKDKMYVSMYTENSYVESTFNSSTKLTFTNAITIADYVFEGWYFEVGNSTTKIWDPYTGLVSNVKYNGKKVTNSAGQWEWEVELTGTTIYPKFVPIITINLNKDDGSIKNYYVAQNSEKLYLSSSDLKANKGNGAYITNTNNADNLITDTKTGYEFNGWYLDVSQSNSRLFEYDGKVVGSLTYGGKTYTDSHYVFKFNPSDGNYTINLYSKFSISYFQVVFKTKIAGGVSVPNKEGKTDLYLRFGDNVNLYKIVSGSGTESNPYVYNVTEIPTIYNFFTTNGNTLGKDGSGNDITSIKGYRLRWYNSLDGTNPIYSTKVNYSRTIKSGEAYDYQQLFLNTLWSNITNFDSINPIEFYPYIESDLTKVVLNVVDNSIANDGSTHSNNNTLQYKTIDSSGNTKEVVDGQIEPVEMYFDYETGAVYADYEKTIRFESQPMLNEYGYLFNGWFKGTDGKTDIVLKPNADGKSLDIQNSIADIVDATGYKFEYNPIGFDLYGTLIHKTYKMRVDYQYDGSSDLDLYFQYYSRTLYTDEECTIKFSEKTLTQGITLDIDERYGYTFQYWGIEGTNDNNKLVVFTDTAKTNATSVKIKTQVSVPKVGAIILGSIFIPTDGLGFKDVTQKESGNTPIAFTLVGVYEPKYIEINMYSNYSKDNFTALYNIESDTTFEDTTDTTDTKTYKFVFDTYKIYPYSDGTIGQELTTDSLTPTKEGYKFLGWYLEPQFDVNSGNLVAGTTQVIANDGRLLNVEDPYNAGKYYSRNGVFETETVLTLYAHYEIVTYKVYLVPDDADEALEKNDTKYFAKDDSINPVREKIYVTVENPVKNQIVDYIYDSEAGYYYVTLYYNQNIAITCDTIPDDYHYIYSLGKVFSSVSVDGVDKSQLLDPSYIPFTDEAGSEYYLWVNVERSLHEYGVTLQIGDLYGDQEEGTPTFKEIFKWAEGAEGVVAQINIWFTISGDPNNTPYYINYNSETDEFGQVVDGNGNVVQISYGTQIFLYCELKAPNTKYSYDLIGWKSVSGDLATVPGQEDVYMYEITALGQKEDGTNYPMIDRYGNPEEGYVDQNILTISAQRIINMFEVLFYTNASDDEEVNSVNDTNLTKYVKYGTNKFYSTLDDARNQSETGYLTTLPINYNNNNFKVGYELKGWFIDDGSFENVFAISNGELVVLNDYNVLGDDSIIRFEPTDSDQYLPTDGVCTISLYADYREAFYQIKLNLDGGVYSTQIENKEDNIFYVQYLSDKLFIKDYENNAPKTNDFALITYTDVSFNSLKIEKENYFFTSFVLGAGTTIVDYLDYDIYSKEFMFVKNEVNFGGKTYLATRNVYDPDLDSSVDKVVWVYTGDDATDFYATYRGQGKEVNLQVDNETVYTLIVEYGTRNFYNRFFSEEINNYVSYSVANMYPENPLTAAEIAELENLTYTSEINGKTYNAVQKDGYAFLGWDYVFNNITSTKDPQMVFDFNGNYKLYDNGTSTGIKLTDDTVATGEKNILISDENGNWIAVVEDGINLQAKYTALGYRIVLNANSPTGDGGIFRDGLSTKEICIKYGTSEFYLKENYQYNDIDRIYSFIGDPIDVGDLPKSYKPDGFYLSLYFAYEIDAKGNVEPKTIIENVTSDAENGEDVPENNINLQFSDVYNQYFEEIEGEFKWKYVYAEGEDHIDFYAVYIQSLRNIQFFISNDKNNKDQNIDSVKFVVDYKGINVVGDTIDPVDKQISGYDVNYNLFIQNNRSYFYADAELLELDLHSIDTSLDDRYDYKVTSVYAEKYGYTFLGWYERPVAYDIDQNPTEVAVDDDGNYLFDEKGNFIPAINSEGNYIAYTALRVIKPNAEFESISAYTTDGKWDTTTKTTILYPVFKANLYMMNFADNEYGTENNTYKQFFFKYNTDNIYSVDQDSQGIKDIYGHHVVLTNGNVKFNENGQLIYTSDKSIVIYDGVEITLLNIKEYLQDVEFNSCNCNYSDLLGEISKSYEGYNFGGYAVDINQNIYNFISKFDTSFTYEQSVEQYSIPLEQIFIYKEYAVNKLQLIEDSISINSFTYTYDTDKTLNVPPLRYLLQDATVDADTQEVTSINYRFAVADSMYLYPVKQAKKYEINFITSQTDDGQGNISYEYETYYIEYGTLNIYEKVLLDPNKEEDRKLIELGEYELFIVNGDGTTSYYRYERNSTSFPPIVYSNNNYERIKGWKLVSTNPDNEANVINLENEVLLCRFLYNGTNNPTDPSTTYTYNFNSSIIDSKAWCFAGGAVFEAVYENNGYSLTFNYVENDEKSKDSVLVQDEEDPNKINFTDVVDGKNSYRSFVIYNLYNEVTRYSIDTRTTQNRIAGLESFENLPVLSSEGYTFIGWEATLLDGTKLSLIYDVNSSIFIIGETNIDAYVWKITEDLVFTPVFEANYYAIEFIVEEKSSINKDGRGVINNSPIPTDEDVSTLTLYYLFDSNEIYTLNVDDVTGDEVYTKVENYANPTAKQVGYRFLGWRIGTEIVTNQDGVWRNDTDTLGNYYINDKFIYAGNDLKLTALFEAVTITIIFKDGNNVAVNDTQVNYNISDSNFKILESGDNQSFAYTKAYTTKYDKEHPSQDSENLVELVKDLNIPTIDGYNFKGWVVKLSNNEIGYLYLYNTTTSSLELQALDNYSKEFEDNKFVFNYVKEDNEYSNSTIELYPYFEACEYTITFNYNFDEYNQDKLYSTYDNPNSETYYYKFDTNEIYKRDENGVKITSSLQTITNQKNKADYSPNFLEGHKFLGWGIEDVDGSGNDIFNQILAYYEDTNVNQNNTSNYKLKLGKYIINNLSTNSYFRQLPSSTTYVFKSTDNIELVAKYEIRKYDVYFIEYVEYDKNAKVLIADPIKELPQNGESTEVTFEYPYKTFTMPSSKPNASYKYDEADGYYRNKGVSSTTYIYKKVEKDYGKTLTDLSYVAFQNVDTVSFINPYYMVSSYDEKSKTKEFIGLYQFNQPYKTGEDGKVLKDEKGNPIIDNTIYNEKFTKDIPMLKELNVDKTLVIELVYQLNSFTVEFFKRVNDTDFEVVYSVTVNYNETINTTHLNNAKELITNVQTDAFNYTFMGSWLYKETLDKFATNTKINKNIQLIPSYKQTDREYIVQFIDEKTGAMIDVSSLLSENSPNGFYLTPPQDKTNISFSVKYGQTFDFVINLVEGYTDSVYNVVYYKTYLAEGEKVVENNVQSNMFGYSIQVLNDVSIKVKNVKLNTYKVTFKMPNGTLITKDVTHGQSVVDKPTVEVGFLQFVKYSKNTDRVTKHMDVVVKIIDVRIYAIIAVALVVVAIIISMIVKSNRKKQQKKALSAQSAHLMNSFGSLNKTYTGQNPQQQNGNNPQQNTFGSTPSGTSVGGTNTTTNTNQTPPSTGATNTNANPYANNGSSTGGSSTSSSTNNSNPYKNPYSDK